jgi:quercetin dioxygenase-like cupin family protein
MPDRTLREIADSIAQHTPRWLTYNDGGGLWRCTVLDEEPCGGDPLKPGGTVLRIEAGAGSRFGVHNHYTPDGIACTEVFVVLCGVFEVGLAEGEPLRLSPGDSFRVPPGEEHAVHAVTDVVVIAASIPTARGYGHVLDDVDRESAGTRPGNGEGRGGPAA